MRKVEIQIPDSYGVYRCWACPTPCFVAVGAAEELTADGVPVCVFPMMRRAAVWTVVVAPIVDEEEEEEEYDAPRPSLWRRKDGER